MKNKYQRLALFVLCTAIFGCATNESSTYNSVGTTREDLLKAERRFEYELDKQTEDLWVAESWQEEYDKMLEDNPQYLTHMSAFLEYANKVRSECYLSEVSIIDSAINGYEEAFYANQDKRKEKCIAQVHEIEFRVDKRRTYDAAARAAHKAAYEVYKNFLL